MKTLKAFCLLGGAAVLGSCSSTVSNSDDAIGQSSEVNPLDLMIDVRAARTDPAAEPMGSGFIAGDTVEVAAVNTPLFSSYPKSGAIPSKLLESGTVLEVIGTQGRYLHVSYGDAAGYVPDMMVVPQGVIDSMPAGEVVVNEEIENVDSAPEELDINEGVVVSQEELEEVDAGVAEMSEDVTNLVEEEISE
ncbi:hypothetical protein ACFPK9_02665 [Rubritalea spongiae]|uniref:SH3 domain-containing protein n=1 Tax=Rubritalea spongiae TaxID=430797 RepID=A0ABW5E267_9BACT